MNERLRLKKDADNILLAWASIRLRTGSEDVDGVQEREDVVIFTIHNTKRNREFVREIDNMTAEATRAMPGRPLPVESVHPTADRMYIMIQCEG